MKTNGTILCKASFTSSFLWTLPTTRQWIWRFGCWYWLCCYTVCTTVILPAAKKLGRELLMSAAPELIDVAMKKKSPKQALKNTVTKTARKQLGSGRRRRKTPINGLRRRRSVGVRKRKTTIRRKTRPVRSRADFFSNIKNDR